MYIFILADKKWNDICHWKGVHIDYLFFMFICFVYIGITFVFKNISVVCTYLSMQNFDGSENNFCTWKLILNLIKSPIHRSILLKVLSSNFKLFYIFHISINWVNFNIFQESFCLMCNQSKVNKLKSFNNLYTIYKLN